MGARRVPVDVVEAEGVSRDGGFAGGCFVVPSMREDVVHRRTSCKNGKVREVT